MSGSLSDILGSPDISALIGAAQGFGQAALPTRMPTPIGSVLGAGLGGSLSGLKTSNELQQGQQQTLAAKMQNMATASALPLMLEKNRALTGMWANPQAVQGLFGPNPFTPGGSSLAPASPSSSPGVISPGDYATRVNLGENSTGNPAAKNPRSSASGNGQFIDDTWLNTFKQAYPSIATGMSDPDILALKTKTTIPGVPDLQGGMTTAYAQQNAPVLQAAGLPATAANLALAHRFGPDGAKTLLQAPPGAPVSSLLGADVMTANPDLKGQTAGGVVGKMTMRMGQAPVAFGGDAGQPMMSPQQAMAAAQWEQQAASRAQMLGLDASVHQTAAQSYLQTALAGSKAFAEGQGGAQFKNTAVRPGGVIFNGLGNVVGAAPFQSNEAIMTGPNAGVVGTVLRSPVTGNTLGGPSPTGGAVPAGGASPAGAPTDSTTALPPGFIPHALSPLNTEFQHERGETLAQQFNKIDGDAASAIDGNYLFDNLRQAGKGFTMDKFADIRSDAQQWGVTAGHLLGISDDNPTMKAMIDPAATYTDFVKGAGTLLRTAVHDVSSRAAVQEYNLISSTLPHPTTLSQGFNQVADQWQGVNDFRIAKQRFAQQYQGHPQDFNVDFNGQVSPVSFMLNRMSLTPEGQVNLTTMLGDMQKTAEGRAAAQHMLHQYSFAKSKGLFDGLPPTSAPPQ